MRGVLGIQCTDLHQEEHRVKKYRIHHEENKEEKYRDTS